MIVIPMAGLSRRFTEAGYALPKYMLPLGEKTVFDHAIGSFEALFKSEPFLLIVRDVMETPAFVEQSCRTLGIERFEVVSLDAPTAGQADTVAKGLEAASTRADTPLTIFNIDTFRPGFTFPSAPWWAGCHGYLEVFRGSGANWSYVRPKAPGSAEVIETAEKKPISDLCCTGLYHFARADRFIDALEKEKAAPSSPELYVAPLYNHVIEAGGHIFYNEIKPEEVIFCGVPSEYEALKPSVG